MRALLTLSTSILFPAAHAATPHLEINSIKTISGAFQCTDSNDTFILVINRSVDNLTSGSAGVSHYNHLNLPFYTYLGNWTLSEGSYKINLRGPTQKDPLSELSMTMNMNFSSVDKIGIGSYSIYSHKGYYVKSNTLFECTAEK